MLPCHDALLCQKDNLLTTCDSPEALLTSSVPYLKLHPLVVQQDLLDLEINPDKNVGPSVPGAP